MKPSFVLVLLLCAYLALVPSLKGYMDARPVAVKLGYLPTGKVLRYTVGDQKALTAELAVLKVLFYFGSLVEEWQNRVSIPPEYYGMYRMIESAIKLDPYNMDAYYFAQAAFTWEIDHASDVNRLLAYGMKYRTWDWYLPFFKGFNEAFFLKDYEAAGVDMQKAADLSGSQLFTNLSARYFYESGHNDLGITYLQSMIAKERDPKVKSAYVMRLRALESIQVLEEALSTYQQQYGKTPDDLQALVESGLIEGLPLDPYGGHFYLDSTGKIRSSSSLAPAKN